MLGENWLTSKLKNGRFYLKSVNTIKKSVIFDLYRPFWRNDPAIFDSTSAICNLTSTNFDRDMDIMCDPLYIGPIILRYLLGLQPCAEHVTASNFGYVLISKLGSNLDPPDPIFFSFLQIQFTSSNSWKYIFLEDFFSKFLWFLIFCTILVYFSDLKCTKKCLGVVLSVILPPRCLLWYRALIFLFYGSNMTAPKRPDDVRWRASEISNLGYEHLVQK